MPVIQLALLSITLRDVVQRIRAQAAKINPSFVEDTFNLMREIVDCTKLKHTYDLLVSLFAQEMEQLLEHGEFAKFAAFCCH
ncbi:transferase family protein [Colletotrichum tofieldiae]|nr:transferase family protein [Colletotrichum tofieldiae]GKT93156.1 transferase family protein [Colletotrichum tofieldiae]